MSQRRRELRLARLRRFGGGNQKKRRFKIGRFAISAISAISHILIYSPKLPYFCIQNRIRCTICDQCLTSSSSKDGHGATRAMICLSRGGQDAFQAATAMRTTAI